MKILAPALLTLTLTVTSLPAIATTPTDASLAKLMQVMDMDNMMNSMLKNSENMLANTMRQVPLPIENLSASQHQQVRGVMTNYSNKMLQELNTPELREQVRQAFIKAAKQGYTQAEVDAQINFYGSRVGQSIIQKQPQVMQNYIQTVMPLIMQRSMQASQKYIPQMQQELEAIVNQK